MNKYGFLEDEDEVSALAFKIHRERGPEHTVLFTTQLIFPNGCYCYDRARADISKRWKEAAADAKERSAKYAAPDLFEPREL
jgi:hypothetical protein